MRVILVMTVSKFISFRLMAQPLKISPIMMSHHGRQLQMVMVLR